MKFAFHRLVAALMSAGAALGVGAADYVWQEPQAEVLPTGELRWQPRPFVFEAGTAVRYIDYEQGNDANAGDSAARPWKHHPWDARATARAKADNGPYTYVFKQGVTYRGRLVASLAGTAERPIILTSDPSWGRGEAVLAGSEQVTGWQRGGHPDMPDANRVWHADLDFLPRTVWLATPGGLRRLALARTPNWEIERWDDIHSQWATWKQVDQVVRDGEQVNRGADPELLNRYPPGQIAGAMVWSEYDGYMGTAYPTPVLLSQSAPGSIEFKHWVGNATQWTQRNNRYFLEDRPAFLDAPGEFWFDRQGSGGRLYVRLPGDVEPSTAEVEVGRHLAIVDATHLAHVRIRGLTFRCTNLLWDLTEHPIGNTDVDPAAIRLLGSCEDLVIDHCRFEHVARAVRLRAAPDDRGVIDAVRITDNEVRDTDHGAFYITDGYRWAQIAPPYARVGHVAVLRNRCDRIGFRPYPRSHGHAIQIDYAERMEVAGNMLDRIHGAGVFLFGGIADGQSRDAPLSRHLVFQNRICQPLLGTNDWGGIETWQAGPFYIFNNVSIDPGGYQHARFLEHQKEPGPRTFRDSRFAFAYYLDGSAKNYVFNNIALGYDNNPASPGCNAGAFYETLPQDNVFFNNSAARFAAAFVGFTRTAANSVFLGNVMEDISVVGWCFGSPEDQRRRRVLHQGQLALAGNFLAGRPAMIGTLPETGRQVDELPPFREALASLGVAEASVGDVVPVGLIPRYGVGDFRLATGTAAAGRGARVFVPWGLYGCVAEWNFRPRHDDPSVVSDNHWYLTWGYVDRAKYAGLPRHNLHGVGIGRDDFVAGPLDNWTPSALRLDGTTQYLVLPDASLYRPKRAERTSWQKPGPPLTFDRTQWRTPDVGTHSFLIEAYLRPTPGRGGLILAKGDGHAGYVLDLDERGCPRLRLESAGRLVAERTAASTIADDKWHHLVVEVDRARSDGIRFWVDGRPDAGSLQGQISAADLDNSGDVLVGGGPGRSFFRGELAFLRICLGTFADARTSIDELRAWEFAGPQFADFTGRVPVGKRDAGALQQEGSR